MKTRIRSLSRLVGEVLVIALVPGALALAFAVRPEPVGPPPSAPSLAEAERLIAEAAARRERLGDPESGVTPADPRLQPAVPASRNETTEVTRLQPASAVMPIR